MARDRRSSGRRANRGDDDTVEFTPVDQLEEWRTWRHDTAELPAVVPGDWRTEELDEPGPRRERVHVARPGSGVLIGGGLVAAALLLSGLAALGVGPVRELLGSGNDRAPSRSTSGAQSGSSSGGSSSSGERANGGSASSAHHGAGASAGDGSRVAAGRSARVGGPPAPAAGRVATGPAAVLPGSTGAAPPARPGGVPGATGAEPAHGAGPAAGPGAAAPAPPG